MPPPKIPARPFVLTIDGEQVKMRGGYYPAIYDREMGFTPSDPADFAALFDNRAAKAMTPHGHTIARVENAPQRPLMFSLDLLSGHLQQVVHAGVVDQLVRDVHRLVGVLVARCPRKLDRALDAPAEAELLVRVRARGRGNWFG